MSNQAPWLCQYNSYLLFPNFVIDITYPKVIDARLDFQMENNLVRYDIHLYEKSRDIFLKLMKNIREGEYIEKEYMPTHAYLLPNKELPPNNTPMFRASSGIFLVNQSVYDVFCNHTLGQTHFSQVYIYDIMTEQKVCDTPYYFINVAERRQYLNIELSKGIQENDLLPSGFQELRYINQPKDGDILLNKEALICDVDVWYDTLLSRSLFFSDRLVQNLFEIGIKKEEFGLVRCRVV